MEINFINKPALNPQQDKQIHPHYEKRKKRIKANYFRFASKKYNTRRMNTNHGSPINECPSPSYWYSSTGLPAWRKPSVDLIDHSGGVPLYI